MDVPHNQVFSPSTFQELFASWSQFPDGVLFAGGTGLLFAQGNRNLILPPNVISISKISELRRITRTERYLEMGACVTLNEILALGKIVPEALSLALQQTGTPQIRNLATIGGNLCCAHRRRDASAAMVALDARYELRTAQSSRWISAARFVPDSGPPLLESQELLTRIRVPLEPWDYTLYRKLGDRSSRIENNGVATFLARAQKDILSEVRLVFAGAYIFRDRDIEAALTGKTLPLGSRETTFFLDRWKNRLGEEKDIDSLVKDQLLHFIEAAVMDLSD